MTLRDGPSCLTSDANFTSLLQSLGTMPRTYMSKPLSITIDAWLSSNLMSTIATILLKEVMGYPVNFYALPQGVMQLDVLCADETLLGFEAWPNNMLPQTASTDSAFYEVPTPSTGYEGGLALYVTADVMNRYPL